MVARADDAADNATESGRWREREGCQVVQDDSSGTAEKPDDDPCDNGDDPETVEEAESDCENGQAYGNEPLKRRPKQSNDEAEDDKKNLKAPLAEEARVKVMGGHRFPNDAGDHDADVRGEAPDQRCFCRARHALQSEYLSETAGLRAAYRDFRPVLVA